MEFPGEFEEEASRMHQIWDEALRSELVMPGNYTSIAVLIVHWAKDLDEEVGELQTLFQEDFRFDTKVVILDNFSRRPQLQLDKAMTDFVHDYDGSPRTHLMIVYYTGHGYTYVDRREELIISGTNTGEISANDNRFQPNANWTKAECALDDACADTLLILDCCSASNIMKGANEHKRSYELMAATGKNLPASGPGPNSYTRALIKSLRILREREEQPFNTSDLSQMIIKERNWNTASQLFSRLPNTRTRHICLAPLDQTNLNSSQQPKSRAAHLDLRLIFKDDQHLELEDVRKIACELSKLPRKTNLSIYDIEWKGFTPWKDCQ